MAEQNASIEEFAYRYFSLPQTALVDNMLYEDKHMELYNGLYNLHVYTVELSTGPFMGTHEQLMIKKAAINKVLQQRNNEVLQQDIDALETINGIERTIYDWYPVPYWIARFLIDSNEVVLSWKDCYWWGRDRTGESIIFDSVIQELHSSI